MNNGRIRDKKRSATAPAFAIVSGHIDDVSRRIVEAMDFRRRVLTLVCRLAPLTLLLLTSCASLQGPVSPPKVSRQNNQQAMAAFDQYMGCMQRAAQRYAPAHATAFEIAAAAQADCNAPFVTYKHHYETYLQSLVSPGSAELAKREADRHVEESKRQARDRVVQIVVNARLPDRESAKSQP